MEDIQEILEDFLVEAFEHLERQCKTVEDREVLQESSIFGGEAKSLPYLLVPMNLLLHGLEYPRIDPENSLVPVCPNCHAMLHKGKLCIEELRKILGK